MVNLQGFKIMRFCVLVSFWGLLSVRLSTVCYVPFLILIWCHDFYHLEWDEAESFNEQDSFSPNAVQNCFMRQAFSCSATQHHGTIYVSLVMSLFAFDVISRCEPKVGWNFKHCLMHLKLTLHGHNCFIQIHFYLMLHTHVDDVHHSPMGKSHVRLKWFSKGNACLFFSSVWHCVPLTRTAHILEWQSSKS